MIKFKGNIADLNSIALFNSHGFQALDNASVSHKFLEEVKSFFGLQIGVAKHLIDRYARNDKGMRRNLVYVNAVSLLFGRRILNKEFSLKNNRFGFQSVPNLNYLIEKLLNSFSGCSRNRK